MCGHSDGWQYCVLIRRRSTSKICGQDVTLGVVGEAVQVQVVAAALPICWLMFPNVVYHPFHYPLPAPPPSHTSCIGYFACCRVSLVSSSLLFLLLMSSLWQRDRCPLSPLPAPLPPPPPLALSYCLALPVLFHFSVLLLCFFSHFIRFLLSLRLTVVRWSDSPRAATIATHLNFIGSPVTLPFRTHTHTYTHSRNNNNEYAKKGKQVELKKEQKQSCWKMPTGWQDD